MTPLSVHGQGSALAYQLRFSGDQLRKFQLGAAVVALGAVLAYGSAASSAVLVATYTGTVQDGLDGTGAFGGVNADLTGATFVASFTYDTTIGAPTGAGGWDDRFGGIGRAAPSPMLSASLQINGTTITLDTQAAGLVGVMPGEVVDPTLTVNDVEHQATQIINNPVGATGISLSLFGRGVDLPTSLDGSYSGPVILGFGQVEFSSQSFGLVFPPDIIDLTPTELTIAPAGVPEPSLWALMLMGFGGAGAMLRRKRAATILSAT